MGNVENVSFDLIKKVASNISKSKRMSKNIADNSEVPNVLGIKLTNRCNLRCKHCYEWNDAGYHHNISNDYKNADIDIEIIKNCLKETEKTDAMVYLWGGEPLIYTKIKELLQLLHEYERYTIICTNGTMLNKYYEEIFALDDQIELLIAIDGDKTSHDALRGKGNFEIIMSQIKPIIEQKKLKNFHGKVSIHTMVSNENIGNLYDIVCFLDSIGIDNLLLCLPWYISEKTSLEMDEFFEKNFSNLSLMSTDVPSWYAYKYKIKKENYKLVNDTLKKIRETKFSINIKFQPDISDDELLSFLEGNSIEKCDKRDCYTIFSRADILPNGLVTSCKHFHEFAYGDLNNSSLSSIWKSKELEVIRKTVSNKQMPVCSKCNNLYNHSYKKG